MEISFWPKTRAGKLSAVFIAVSVGFTLLINAIGTSMGLPGNSDIGFWGNIPLALMASSALLAAVASAIAGVFAVRKKKERSMVVYFCIIAGVLAVYFATSQVFGEVTNTH